MGAELSQGGTDTFSAVNPETGEALQPHFAEATASEVDRAMRLARDAAGPLSALDREERATFLEAVASGLEALGESLIKRAHLETGLPTARLHTERGRTAGQLRLMAAAVRDGAYLGVRLDRAQADRAPVPKPDIRRIRRPVGPVVVFGASNFPLAFSVAGGDTASALAAGCPVVVKAHPHHAGTSELVGGMIAGVARSQGLPAGTFSLLHGRTKEVGLELVRHPETRAVAFTGSFAGGKALYDAAQARPRPIPVHAEMGSVNPLFLLPGILRERAQDIADGVHLSVTLGVGQFCTNPGLLFVPTGRDGDRFMVRLRECLEDSPGGTMLHRGIRDAFVAATDRVGQIEGVTRAGHPQGSGGPGGCDVYPVLFEVGEAVYQRHEEFSQEMFGPATLSVRFSGEETLLQMATALEGQLTASIFAGAADVPLARRLLPILEERVGRIVWNAPPTGVEVCDSMHHGGPFPATTDAAATSVGTAAIDRFTRPIAYQGFPEDLLPVDLVANAPRVAGRRVDGRFDFGAK